MPTRLAAGTSLIPVVGRRDPAPAPDGSAAFRVTVRVLRVYFWHFELQIIIKILSFNFLDWGREFQTQVLKVFYMLITNNQQTSEKRSTI